MTVADFLTTLTRIVFLLLALVTVVQWLRTRDRSRLDIALAFVSLSLSTAIQEVEGILGRQIAWLDQVGTLALLAHPYFLLRIAHYFRPVGRRVRLVALLGLLLSVVLVLTGSETLSGPAVLLVIAYFVGVESYATSIFIRGALTTTGITRQRLRLASTGSALLAAIILTAGVLLVAPAAVSEAITPLIQLFAVLAGLSYYVGFSPPRWLRHAWQLTELQNYLRDTAGHWAQQSANTFSALIGAAIKATGGMSAIIAPWDFERKTLSIDAPGDPPWRAQGLENGSGTLARCWRDRRARIAYLPRDVGPEAAAWAEQAGARSLIVVPLASLTHTWGLLVVALRHAPLFPDDDLELLAQLAGQTAVILDHGRLLEELKSANSALEQRVSERTAALQRSILDLQSSEERYRNTLDTMLEGAQIIGFDWRYVYANATAAAQVGQPQEGVIGHTLMEVFPGINEGDAMANLERCMRERVSQHFETTFSNEDGMTSWYELSAHPVPEGIFILSMDITERKVAQALLLNAQEELERIVRERTAALSKANTLLQTLMDNTPDHIYFKDAGSRFVRNSRSQARMMGLKDPEQAVGKTDFDFFPVEHAQRSFDEEQQVIKSGRPLINIEERVLWPDGHITWVSTTKLPYRDAAGNVIGTFGISREITERKQAEEALRRSNAQLEAANKELESFSYSVSHDLRAPLRSIDGFSLALLEDFGEAIPAEGRGHLERVRAAAQRMAQLIDDILELSRVARAPLARRQVDLSALAESVAGELQREQPDRKVELVIQPELSVEADPALLRIALENLMGNAWKFTSKREAAHIELGVQNGAGEPVFFLRDNGSGFDMHYVEKLFGAFQRLHTNEEFPGTGIGLATVQRVFHKHGGRVWAEGEPNRGATFYFTL